MNIKKIKIAYNKPKILNLYINQGINKRMSGNTPPGNF